MSAKDNFAQAMKELLNSGEGEGIGNTEDKKPAPSTFSSFSQPEARPPRAPAPEKKESGSLFGGAAPEAEDKESEAPAYSPMANAVEEVPAPVAAFSSSSVDSAFSAPAPLTSAPVAPAYSVPAAPSFTSSEEGGSITVIAAGTTIVGDITTSAGLTVNGDIKGNVRVASLLELNGKIIGDIEADAAVFTASQIKGNVTVKNTLNMDNGTTIIGDVAAKNTEINGKIKGNLTVDERGHFEREFILVGNLVSGTVIIDEGAMLKGDIAITNAQTENITVEEPDFDIEI